MFTCYFEWWSAIFPTSFIKKLFEHKNISTVAGIYLINEAFLTKPKSDSECFYNTADSTHSNKFNNWFVSTQVHKIENVEIGLQNHNTVFYLTLEQCLNSYKSRKKEISKL